MAPYEGLGEFHCVKLNPIHVCFSLNQVASCWNPLLHTAADVSADSSCSTAPPKPSVVVCGSVLDSALVLQVLLPAADSATHKLPFCAAKHSLLGDAMLPVGHALVSQLRPFVLRVTPYAGKLLASSLSQIGTHEDPTFLKLDAREASHFWQVEDPTTVDVVSPTQAMHTSLPAPMVPAGHSAQKYVSACWYLWYFPGVHLLLAGQSLLLPGSQGVDLRPAKLPATIL
jgi:hypothetical protein